MLLGIVMTCVAAPALPRVLPHRRIARPPGQHRCGQRRGDLGAPSRERGPAPAESDTAPGLGRPSGARRPDQIPAPGVGGAPARHSDHGHALASAAGRPPLDISQPVRPAADRPSHHRPGRADVPGQPRLGLPTHPRRTARPRPPCERVHDPADPQPVGHPTGARAP